MIAIGTIGTIIESCNSDESTDMTAPDNKEQFAAALNQEILNFYKTPIILPKSKGLMPDDLGPKPQGYATVYIDFTTDDGSTPIPVRDITTPDELLVLVRDFDASFSFEDDGSGDSTLVISEEDANNSLKPLIQKSKEYLYGIGFTEAEIQAMLIENNATEAELVPFVVALVEEEKKGNLYTQNQSWSPLSFFSTPAYAADITWKKAGDCALTVIGIDIFKEMATSGAKKVTVALAKKAFSTVAKKILGPVGAVIALVEFSACLFDF